MVSAGRTRLAQFESSSSGLALKPPRAHLRGPISFVGCRNSCDDTACHRCRGQYTRLRRQSTLLIHD